jgi:hypothetical protein
MFRKVEKISTNFYDDDIPDYITVSNTVSGRPKLLKCDDKQGFVNGNIAHFNLAGPYTRNISSSLSSYWNPMNLIGMGYGAFGDAGNIGNWDELIVTFPDETIIRAKPCGGSKSYPTYYYFGKEKVETFSEEDLFLFLDAIEKPLGEVITKF